MPLTNDQRAILEEIKELYRRREHLNIAAEGLRLNTEEVVQRDRTLYKWAKHYFGTYRAAVERA
jgi:hypothetical protein